MEFLDVDLYTDGACSGNPGAGGWGYVLICKAKEKNHLKLTANTFNSKERTAFSLESYEFSYGKQEKL